VAWAQSPALEIGAASAAGTDAAPRSITTVALRITNNSGAAGEFEARLALPQGWRLITPEQPFTLARGASVVRMVGLFVPEAAAAGEHTLAYTLASRSAPAVQGKYSLAIRVAPSVKLKLTLLDMPDMVIAGEPYTGTFLLHNKGNAPVTVDYKAHSSRGYVLDLPAGEVTLQPGNSRTFKLRVVSEPVAAIERDWLVLAAQARGGSAMERATGVIKVVPRITGSEQRYNTIPASAGLRVVGRQKDGQRGSSIQAEIIGGGKLGDGGERYLDFLLRGPGAASKSVFGRLDEYRVEYRDASVAVGLGDLNYGLSPLTELGRYGRGVSASYQAGSATLRAYAMKDRFSRPALAAPGLPVSEAGRLNALNRPLPDTAVTEQALGIGYAYGDTTRFDMNYLRKRDASCPSGADILSLRERSRWASGLGADVEYGQSACAGVRGNAFRVDLSDHRYRMKYNFSIIKADSQYRGYNPDQQLAVFNADYPVTAALSVHANHRVQQSNRQLAPTRAALDETQSGAGVGYQFPDGSRADLDYIARDTVDLRPLSDFDASHRAARLSLRQQYNRLSLFGSVESGTTTDLLRHDRFPARQLLTSAYWAASDRLAWGAYFFYVDNAYTTRRDKSQSSVGATIRYAFSDKTMLDGNLQANRAKIRSSGADLVLSHRRANGDVVTFAVRRAAAGTANQVDMVFGYAVPLSVPVSRRQNVATVTGRVFEQATGKGVPDLLLRLGGSVAVSGSNGEYSFPSILIGTYYLSVDQLDGVSGKIPVEPMPMAVAVRNGADAHIDIALVQSATLTGSITLHDAPAAFAAAVVGAGAEQVATVVPRNLLVILRTSAIEFKRLTDEHGRFRLGGIPPGQWIVSVDEQGIPAGYELEKNQFMVNLAPAGEAVLEFKLRQKIRAIKMLQQMGPVGK
jgi:hypothetical protein